MTMLSVVLLNFIYAQGNELVDYAGCWYSECHHAECRCASELTLDSRDIFVQT
jgi:hypothetical protein